MMKTAQAFARCGLVGNPSDGYFGKTISCVVRDFAATVSIRESSHFEIQPGHGDLCRFSDTHEFLRDQKLHGYYGGMRLIKATIRRFHEHFATKQQPLDKRSFTVEYASTIPRLVGLSGSSAIVVATLRALMQFYGTSIALQELPQLTLSVERDELSITAGLQDRVIQNYEGIVYMNFDRELIESRGFGEYVLPPPSSPPTMPPLYLAFDPDRAEVSDVPHRNLKELFAKGDPKVVNAMEQFRQLTERGRVCLMAGDWKGLGEVMDGNFDLRCTIMPIAPENLQMVQTARAAGASAKFAGSGGAICGLFRDADHLRSLTTALAAINCTVLQPTIFPA